VGPIIALNLGLRPSAINPTDFLFQLKLKEKNSGTAIKRKEAWAVPSIIKGG